MRRTALAPDDQGVRWMPTLAALAWMSLIFTLSSRSRIPDPPGLPADLTSIAGHFTVYAVLAILFWWAGEPLALTARRRFVLALSGAVVYGLTDEWHQAFVPGRDASLLDVMVDGIGACCGLVAMRMATLVRRDPGESEAAWNDG